MKQINIDWISYDYNFPLKYSLEEECIYVLNLLKKFDYNPAQINTVFLNIIKFWFARIVFGIKNKHIFKLRNDNWNKNKKLKNNIKWKYLKRFIKLNDIKIDDLNELSLSYFKNIDSWVHKYITYQLNNWNDKILYDDFYDILEKQKDKDFLYIDDFKINNKSVRYEVFRKSKVCAMCWIKGLYFKIQKGNKNDMRPHINLYWINNKWLEILFTKDHIIPLSKWWPDNLDNLQTMCHICNCMIKKDLIL